MWLLDHVAGAIPWANAEGLRLWGAESLAALTARDFSPVSAAVRTRTHATAAVAFAGGIHRERWTMFPDGRPRTVDLLVSGVLVNGEPRLLLEAAEIEAVEDEVRAVEAVRHASSLLTLFGADGQPLYRNPAALAAYAMLPYREPMADPAAGAALWQEAADSGVAEATLELRTAAGPRWHAMVLRATPDPATGAPAFLLDERDVSDAVRATAELTRLAAHDSLTGLPNRAAFNARAESACQTGAPFAIGLIDLDRFKTVNDTLGHAAGDALLIEAARRMRAAVDGDVVLARLGGDEFALLVAGQQPVARAEAIGGAIVASLGRAFVLQQGQVSIGASIGFALAPDHGDSADQLLLEADAALYLVKRAGRGAFRIAMGGDAPAAWAA